MADRTVDAVSASHDDLASLIDPARLAQTLAELIAIPSVNPFSQDAWNSDHGEVRIARHVAERLRALNWDVTVDEFTAGKANVVGQHPGNRVPATDSTRHSSETSNVVLTGHLDARLRTHGPPHSRAWRRSATPAAVGQRVPIARLLPVTCCTGCGRGVGDGSLVGVEGDVEAGDDSVPQISCGAVGQGCVGDHAPGRCGDVVALLVGLLDECCGGWPVGLLDQAWVELVGQLGPPLGRGHTGGRLEPRADLVSVELALCGAARIGVPCLDRVA